MFALIRAAFLLCFWFGLYYLPTIVAFRRRSQGKPTLLPPPKIFFINLIFGWTIYGWWVAMQLAIQDVASPGSMAARLAGGDAAGQGPSERPMCPRCNGAGKETCSRCHGQGGQNTQPQGEHGTSHWEQCTACHGSGTLQCMGGCGGTGRL
jgi:hypothetical protein